MKKYFMRAPRLSLVYAICGFAWIMASDWLVSFFILSPVLQNVVQTGKGFGYVLVTAILVYFLIRRNERRCVAIFDHSFDAMFIQNATSGALVTANAQTAQIYGYSPDRMCSASPTALSSNLISYTRDEYMAWLARAVAGENPCFEWQARRQDGSLFWLEIGMRRIPDIGRDLVLVTARDITNHKKNDDRLRQAAMVFDHTQEGVIITDPAGHILDINAAFTVITGYNKEEVLGRTPVILKSGRHDPLFYKEMWAALSQNGCWQGEIWNRRKNGDIYPQWLSISTVHDDAGRPSFHVGVFADISDLRRSERQIDHLIHHDPLTGLPNRLLLHSRLDHALEQARRHGIQLGLLCINLDHFKVINDSLGLPAGDELLVAVAHRFSSRLRQDDTLGRMEGDSFMLLLEPVGDPQEAAVVARDLLRLLDKPFPRPDEKMVHISASIGICLHPADGAAAAELLRNAESAMYHAKDNGGNQFCFYTEDIHTNALAKLDLEAALRRAIEGGELVLHYQAKVNTRSGIIAGAEALVRWRREDGILVPPAMFIPLAEKTGLILAIGNWVINEACRQMRAWLDCGLVDTTVAVNVSAQQFRFGDLAAVVTTALGDHRIPPASLELELTESMLVERPEEAVALLDHLKAIGVKLTLDDFGTGYSSFAYLSRFPIHTLKIDQSFVRDISINPHSAMIATAIITLAHRMGLRVVAEGVEHEAQYGYLRKHSCDEIQGYLFSRPLPADSFAELLRKGRSFSRLIEEQEGTKRSILLVDDEPQVIASLLRVLSWDGCRLLSAGSAAEALEVMATENVQVILSDQCMPQMSGTEFLEKVKALYPDTVRIILTGHGEIDAVIMAINKGAIYKFVTKPWDNDALRALVDDAFGYYDSMIRPRIDVDTSGNI